MNIAILIFLVMDLFLLALIMLLCWYILLEDKQKVWKRCHRAEWELEETRQKLCNKTNELIEYKHRYPIKAKYKIGEKVFVKVDNLTFNGEVCGLGITNTSSGNIITQYLIKTSNDILTVSEKDIYLQTH